MFDWRAFLTLARGLATQKDEAALRSAISRAYYSAHNATSKILSDRTEISPTVHHTTLWRFLQSASTTHRKQIGIIGQRLMRRRNDADYEHRVGGLTASTTSSIEDAERIFNLLPGI